MPHIIESLLNPESSEFRARVDHWSAALAEVRELEERVRQNSERSRGKFEKRGQLLPRERLDLLLDRGSPFVALSTLAGLKMHDDDGKKNAAGGGTICGVGFVSGVRCAVNVTDSGIKGGAVSPMGLKKSLRMQEIILENRLPSIVLAESAGANLFYQTELFIEGGRAFANQARISAAGIPQVTVVHGSSTAGGAYLPGLSDHVVLVRGKSKIFLAGPPLLKAATGEIATDEELGGADMHAEVAGTGEYMAEDDAEAIETCRDVVAHLGWDGATSPRVAAPREPLYSPDELLGVVPEDPKIPYDCREVIARIVDGSEFLEHKPGYGTLTVCGRAMLDGRPVGILGNNGPIDPAGATKAAQFIQLCEQTRTPLLFLMNTTGYIVGKDAERGGIVKHGSKMIQAVANCTVPKVTIVVGGSWGAGNYGMAGRGLSPRFIFSWPSAKVGVMGPQQAAKVMQIVAAEKFARHGAEMPQEMLDEIGDDIIKRMEPETAVLFGTARLWDDGIIDPRDTRRVAAFCLATCREGDARQVSPVSFGVARM